MVIGNDTIYNYSCNKQTEYNPAANHYEGNKYLFCLDIYKNEERDSVVSLNFSSVADIAKFRDCLNAFLRFSGEMVV